MSVRVWLVTSALALAAVHVAAAQGKIVVGPNVMVSAASPGREHSEYFADAHPTDPSRVMVCSMRFSQARNQNTTVIYTTFDRGKNWTLSLEDSASRFTGVWDPACAYGLSGQAFFATLILPDTARTDSTRYDVYQWWRMAGDNNMHLYRSMDDGRTWSDTVLLPMIDAQTVTVDRTASAYRGRLYIYGNTRGRGLWLIYSADGGRTWMRSERTDTNASVPRAGTVLPTGTLVVPYYVETSRPNNAPLAIAIAVSKTTDGGLHLNPPITVSNVSGRDCSGPGGTLNTTSDHSTGPFRGRAYVTWADVYRFGRCAAFVSYSDNEGQSWSQRIRVSDARPRQLGTQTAALTSSATERLMPKIAVSRSGVVGVTWYDAREDTTNRSTKLRFAASLDGGETWQPSVPVSTHGFVVKDPPEFAAHTRAQGGGERRGFRPAGGSVDVVDVEARPSPRSYYPWNHAPGDYTGIAVGADGVFHAFWIDNRSGVGELYTARVTVDGVAAKPDADMAPLANVTSALEVQFTSSVWDAHTRTVSWEYQLMNTTKDTIVGPIKIRIADLSSDLGTPTLVLDRDRQGRAGTIIDLSHALADGRLLPGQTTSPQRLQVRLDYARDVIEISEVVHMQVKVYGTRTSATKADSGKKAP